MTEDHTLTWNYRIVRHHSGLYFVSEVYTDEKDQMSWINPFAPMGDTAEDLIEMLETMLRDIKENPVYAESLDKRGKETLEELV